MPAKKHFATPKERIRFQKRLSKKRQRDRKLARPKSPYKINPAADRTPLRDDEVSLSVPFTFVHEVHDREQYQETCGRMLPALRYLRPDGSPIQGNESERPWGKEVHILILKHPMDDGRAFVKPGERTSERTGQGTEVIRIIADSLEECERQARERLPQILFATWAAQFIRDTEAENIKRLHDRMVNWIEQNGHKEQLVKMRIP